MTTESLVDSVPNNVLRGSSAPAERADRLGRDPLAEDYSRKNAPFSARTVASTGQVCAFSLLAVVQLAIIGLSLVRESWWIDRLAPSMPQLVDRILLSEAFVLVALMALPGLHRLFVLFKNFDPLDQLFPVSERASNDADLPTYTILVPLYREEDIVGQTLKAMQAVDYPEDKLQVLLLIEASDAATRAALPVLPPNFAVVDVPPAFPRSKPRSLNHGLARATGDFLVVYDAECVPDPGQLRNAVAAHHKLGDRYWAVQAKLRYNNPEDSWVSLLFCSEIAFWFDRYLPYLAMKRYPIPLGGSSNHFRTDRLREIGGWDAYNMTEDADMTIRIDRRGGRIGLLESETIQRSPIRASTWIKQRTRWIKGFLQCLLVHTRRIPGIRFSRFMLIGMSGSLLLPFSILYCLIVVAAIPGDLDASLIQLGFGAYAVAFLGQAAMCLASLQRYRPLEKSGWTTFRRLVFPGIFTYWLLYLVANGRALLQLLFRPFHWDKTDHRAEA